MLAWADEIGIDKVVEKLDSLYVEYLEDRYRCSPLLREILRETGEIFINMTPAEVFHHMLDNDPFSRWMGMKMVSVGEGACAFCK